MMWNEILIEKYEVIVISKLVLFISGQGPVESDLRLT